MSCLMIRRRLAQLRLRMEVVHPSMAINGMVKRLCMEEDVGYVDLWDSLVGKEEMYARDGLHLSGKGAAVFAEGLSGAVASGLGKVRYLN